MYHIFSIHSSVDAHLGYFHVLAILKDAAEIGARSKPLVKVTTFCFPSCYLILTAVAHQSPLLLLWSCLLVTSTGTWATWGGERSGCSSGNFTVYKRNPEQSWGTQPLEMTLLGQHRYWIKPCCSASLSATYLLPLPCFYNTAMNTEVHVSFWIIKTTFLMNISDLFPLLVFLDLILAHCPPQLLMLKT